MAVDVRRIVAVNGDPNALAGERVVRDDDEVAVVAIPEERDVDRARVARCNVHVTVLHGQSVAQPNRGRTVQRSRLRVPLVQASLTPMLSVQDADAAIDFYERAFGAQLVDRQDFGTVVVAELAIEGSRFYVVTEDAERGNVSPRTHGGRTTVRLDLVVDDPDAVAARAVGAGAHEMFPVADQSYGFRQGRVVDPEGHHWLIGKPLAPPA